MIPFVFIVLDIIIDGLDTVDYDKYFVNDDRYSKAKLQHQSVVFDQNSYFGPHSATFHY